MEEKNIELRSEQVKEILGRPPKWVIRWGISVIFVIIAILLIGSYFFKYPDVIPATIEVTTENLPVQLVSKSSGKFDTIFVADNEIVKTEQYMAIIENSANFSDVFKLKEILSDFNIENLSSSKSFSSFLFPPLNLGDVYSHYYQLIKAFDDYEYFITANYHQQKIEAYRKQINIQQKLMQRAVKQSNIAKEQLQVQERLYNIDSSLYAQKISTVLEYENSKKSLLQMQQSYESTLSSKENIQLTISQYEQNIFDLQQQADEKRKQLLISLSGAYENIQMQIKLWEMLYVFKSPIEGKISLSKSWQNNRHITGGESFANIVPLESTHVTGKIMLPARGAGKVKKGQAVNVKFDGFPYMEFGMVKGVITSISLVPTTIGTEKFTMLEVSFPEQLTTNYGKTLDFSQEMTGMAEIITEDLRLIDRFINPVRAVLKK